MRRLYDMWCDTCRKDMEITDEEVICLKCGKPMRRLISPTNFKIDAYDTGMKWKK